MPLPNEEDDMLTMCEEDYYAELEGDHVATPGEACKEYARNAGYEDPSQEWILTPWDTWEVNPAYTGPRGRHPEDDCYDEEEFYGPFLPVNAGTWEARRPSADSDDIPF
jgi:hypothetical protein